MGKIVRKHPGCGFAPDKIVKVWRLHQSLPQVKELFLRGIGSGEEGEPSWHWGILRGTPTSPNVTYFLAKEGNTGINLRLRVLSVISNRILTCDISACESLCARVTCIII